MNQELMQLKSGRCVYVYKDEPPFEPGSVWVGCESHDIDHYGDEVIAREVALQRAYDRKAYLEHVSDQSYEFRELSFRREGNLLWIQTEIAPVR